MQVNTSVDTFNIRPLFPAPEMPSKPTDLTTEDYDFEVKKYKEGLRRATQQHFGDQDNNLQA